MKWKGCDNSFNSLIDKKDAVYKMSQYFPKLYERSDGNITAELDPPNYATKTII